MEKAHNKKPDCQSVGNEYTILRKINFGKISMEASEQIVYTIVDIRASFAAGNAVIKASVFAPFATYIVKLFLAPQIAPFLFPQSWFLIICELTSRE